MCRINKYKIKAIMFIGSALEKWSNFTSLGSDTLREDEAIQLINYYGKHLLEDMQE